MPKKNTSRKFNQEHEEWIKENVLIAKKKVFSWEPRGERQAKAQQLINTHDLNFFFGSPGSGKSAVAIWEALSLLDKGIVDKIVVMKPMVEIGPSMGFLPGEASEKMSPYLESIHDLLKHYDSYNDLISDGRLVGEPLGFLRGRTFERSFVILDEGQNSTPEQMIAALTRLGIGSRMVVTGDERQSDLRQKNNGLAEAMRLTEGHPDIGVVEFLEEDICRHALVRDIVRAVKAGKSLWVT